MMLGIELDGVELPDRADDRSIYLKVTSDDIRYFFTFYSCWYSRVRLNSGEKQKDGRPRSDSTLYLMY